MGSFLRYVCFSFQIRISLVQHSSELLNSILFVNFVIFFGRQLAVVSFRVPLSQSCRHRS